MTVISKLHELLPMRGIAIICVGFIFVDILLDTFLFLKPGKVYGSYEMESV